jgi:tRNA(fMet)-specific endonuclease VapC
MILLDTCFLIDYQREAQSRQAGPVLEFLQRHADQSLQMSVVAWGEFLAGFANPQHPFVLFAHDKLELFPLTEQVTQTYRSVYRELKAAGALIGANDLWIAAHALALDRPLVSRNNSDFKRVADLKLLTY